MSREKIIVLDFGSQYAHLIAKRFRMLGYYSEIALPTAPLEVFENARGVVFSGGPSSVYDDDAPAFNSDILKLEIPVLGLCYGHYIVQTGYNGKVGKAFLMPQEDPEHHTFLLKSYNRPEFMVEPVKISVEEFSRVFSE